MTINASRQIDQGHQPTLARRTGRWSLWWKLVAAILALGTMATAHHVGFVSKLPLPLIAVAGNSLFFESTGPYIAYWLLAYGFSKAMVSVLQILVPLAALLFEIPHRNLTKSSIFAVRKHFRSLKNKEKSEPYAWMLLQGVFTASLFMRIYVGPNISAASYVFILFLFGLTLMAVLVRAGFSRKPSIKLLARKLRSRKYMIEKAPHILFATITPFLVVCSYFLGLHRFDSLMNQPEQQISNQYYSGYARHLISSTNTLLIFETRNGASRYVLFSEGFAIGVEKDRDTFPLIARPGV